MAGNHPMHAFLGAALPVTTIYDRLKNDFRSDGKKNVHPDTTFYDNPPTGMGYQGAMAMQSFLNTYVNSSSGKKRYNLAPNVNIFVTQVGTPKCVGNLAALIAAKQIK